MRKEIKIQWLEDLIEDISIDFKHDPRPLEEIIQQHDRIDDHARGVLLKQVERLRDVEEEIQKLFDATSG